LNGWGGKRPGSGRPRGSRNRDTTFVQERLQELQCEPLEVLVAIANGDSNRLGTTETIGASLRLKAATELASFIFPKRRSIEATVEQGNSLLEVLQGIAETSAQGDEGEARNAD
jgi:hypothetical protein